MRVVPLTLFALAVAACAPQPKPVQTASNAAADAPAPEKKICRRFGTLTGSAIPSRPICHTKSQWAAIDGANGRKAEDMLHGAGPKYRPPQ